MGLTAALADDEADVARPKGKTKAKPAFAQHGEHAAICLTRRAMTMMRDFIKDELGYYEAEKFRSVFALRILVDNFDAFRCWIDDNDEGEVDVLFEPLVKIVESYRDNLYAAAQERIADGYVLFDDLPVAFKKGGEVACGRGDTLRGGIIDDVSIHRGLFSYVEVKLRAFGVCGSTPSEIAFSFYIEYFDDLKSLSEIGVIPITDRLKERLSDRGRRYRDLVSSVSYVSYDADLVIPSYFGDRLYNARGRVVIDAKNFRRLDNSTAQWCERRLIGQRIGRDGNRDYDDDDEESTRQEAIADGDLWRTPPYVLGFSMRAKRWGCMLVSQISDIAWRGDAFDKLVLPDAQKRMVHALVEHSQGTFTDIIDGKGGGTIFLLHGTPGVGKTTLAEATAEVLRRPLYMVSVGELGTTAINLEARLAQILDLAAAWNAVILIDEADIFLEQRDSNNIERNAMVAIFLRLLEYHDGVLFLTTNRVKEIDDAFLSRLSMAIQFGATAASARIKVWNNLFEAAGVDISAHNLDLDALARHQINNRQIKNAIRNALILSKAQGRAITQDDVEGVVRATLEFISEIKR